MSIANFSRLAGLNECVPSSRLVPVIVFNLLFNVLYSVTPKFKMKEFVHSIKARTHGCVHRSLFSPVSSYDIATGLLISYARR